MAVNFHATDPLLPHHGWCWQCWRRHAWGKVVPEKGDYGQFMCHMCHPEPPVRSASLMCGGRGAWRAIRLDFRNLWESRSQALFRSQALLRYMETHFAGRLRNRRILVTEAGSGIAGLGLSAGGATVTLLEREGLCGDLQANAAMNFSAHCPQVFPSTCRGSLPRELWREARLNFGYAFVVGTHEFYPDLPDLDYFDFLQDAVSIRNVSLVAAGVRTKLPTRVLLAVDSCASSMQAMQQSLAAARWEHRVLQHVDMAWVTGLQMLSSVAIVEVRPISMRPRIVEG